VEAERPHRREALAGLLWPDQPERLARRNLSQALVRLRRAIGDYQTDRPFLRITGKSLQFNAATAELDVVRFEQLVAACAAHSHTRTAVCPSCVARLEAACALYRGDFLQDLFLAGSRPFEEWVFFRREQLHRQALSALAVLALHYEIQGAYDKAVGYAERQLALEPWNEAAHRQRMRALALDGQRGAALAQYQVCRRVLAETVDAQPAPETTALYQRILKGELDPGERETPSCLQVGVGAGSKEPGEFNPGLRFGIVMALLTGQTRRAELLRTYRLSEATLDGWLQLFWEQGPAIFA
jgi:DNA-binding SARP family transcriptional activator